MRALPYGRPSDRSVEGMLREHRGTCSTMHLFLAQECSERFPETEPLIVALEAKHCDPAVREPFIAALASRERPG